ncbi:hypothetical protein C0J52_13244 [Blattella germanica]|nr:hypothetical protein C0J52_13244 [Blattella germanica]
MNSHPPVVCFNRFESTMDDLPDEVLEYILSLVAPYKDLQECSLVCKRWHRSVKNVIRHAQKNLNRAITDFNIRWENITPAEMAPTITKRYSHSACRYGNSMYVFGGCTSTSTTFNDLWRLDLNKRQWVRPLTMGTYPSPKACASIVCYKTELILFGGWTHPSPYPLHQAWRLFNELHVYGIVSNRWTCINTPITPPAMAGHSATIQGKLMVVFGGLQRTNVSLGQYGRASEGLVEPRPVDRDLNINGRRGTLSPRSASVGSAQHACASTSSSSGEESDNDIPGPSSKRPSSEHRPIIAEQGRIAQVHCPPKQSLMSFNDPENAGPSGLGMAAFRDPSPVFKPNATKNRQRQLESLRRMEERIRNLSRLVGNGSAPEGSNGNVRNIGSSPVNNLPQTPRHNAAAVNGNNANTPSCPLHSKSFVTKNAMTMFVLDISHVLTDECFVEWLPVKSDNVLNGEPEEKILYTLIAGKGELIMFGGIQKDATSITPQAQLSSDVPNTVSNSLHFITAPKGII